MSRRILHPESRLGEFGIVYSSLLEGSWVVISGVISRATIIITPIRGLITLLITTHEPPSRRPKEGTLTDLSMLLLRDLREMPPGFKQGRVPVSENPKPQSLNPNIVRFAVGAQTITNSILGFLTITTV